MLIELVFLYLKIFQTILCNNLKYWFFTNAKTRPAPYCFMVKKVLTFRRGSATYIFAVPTSSSYSLAQIGEIVILILLYQICLLRSLTHCKKCCFSQTLCFAFITLLVMERLTWLPRSTVYVLIFEYNFVPGTIGIHLFILSLICILKFSIHGFMEIYGP